MANIRNSVYLGVTVPKVFEIEQLKTAWDFQRNCADNEARCLFILQKLKWFGTNQVNKSCMSANLGNKEQQLMILRSNQRF